MTELLHFDRANSSENTFGRSVSHINIMRQRLVAPERLCLGLPLFSSVFPLS